VKREEKTIFKGKNLFYYNEIYNWLDISDTLFKNQLSKRKPILVH